MGGWVANRGFEGSSPPDRMGRGWGSQTKQDNIVGRGLCGAPRLRLGSARVTSCDRH